MDENLLVRRTFPDGQTKTVMPFHISLEGLESFVICRDDEDYDVMVKNIFLSARRHHVIVIIYCVLSNHAHISVLAEFLSQAKAFANELKKVQSMWISKKYHENKSLRRKEALTTEIHTVRYARNVMAYVVRNAMDNGCKNFSEYKWSGYRGCFCCGKTDHAFGAVKDLSSRQIETIMHSGDNLSDVTWILNERMELEPASTCDWNYLEMLFNHDQSFFLNAIGRVNMAQMNYYLTVKQNIKMNDSEFIRTARDYSMAWYGTDFSSMSLNMKARFIGYLDKKCHLSVPQVARCFGMEREVVARILGRDQKSKTKAAGLQETTQKRLWWSTENRSTENRSTENQSTENQSTENREPESISSF